MWLGFTYIKFKINQGQNEARETFNTGVVVCGIPHVVTDSVENNYLLKRYKNINITTTQLDVDEIVAIYSDSTHVFQKEILKETKLFLNNNNQQINMRALHQLRMSQWMLILLIKRYKLAKLLMTFMQSLSFQNEICLQQKCKLLFLTIMERYNPLSLTSEIF